MAKIDYEGRQTVMEDDLSLTLLEISNQHKVPHVQACRGNARCSTCRVMILKNLENVILRNKKESSLAKKKGFESNIRLACQTKVTGDVKLRLLVQDDCDIKMALAGYDETTGREEKVVILFSDIRGYTSLSEKMLPYDIIHILNRYFLLMGEIVYKYGGYIDKYIGDGLMVLFGIKEESQDDCLNAALAAQEMIDKLQEVNKYLSDNFKIQFQIGIGIHCGEVILGEVGHPDKMQLTAIGDSVNTASRIESMCKKTGSNLLVSEEVYQNIISRQNEIAEKLNLITAQKVYKMQLRGKEGFHRVYSLRGSLIGELYT